MNRKRTRSIPACAWLLAAASCASTPAPTDGEWSGPAAPAETGPAPAEAPARRYADAPALADLLSHALARNPRIRAAAERVRAAREQARVAGALPDPMLMLGWYATPVETRVGPQRWSLGITQPIPWPGTLAARRAIADTKARRAEVVYERTVRDVLVEVTRTAWELRYLDEAARATATLEPLLRRVETATAGEATPLAEHLRAATQRAMLESDRVVLAELRAAETERLRALLDLAAGDPVGTPRLPEPPPVDAGYEELLDAARRHSQELRAAGLSAEAALARLDLARSGRAPEFSIGFTRILTDRLATADPPGNGTDPEIVQLGVRLPLWAGRDRAEIRAADAEARAALEDRRDADARLRERLARTWYEVGNARRLVELYDDLLIPRAEEAVAVAEALQEGGRGSWLSTIEAITALQHFRLAAARARADLGRAVAALEGVLGTPLAARAEGDPR